MQTCGLDRRGLQDDGDAEVLYKGTIPGEACDFPDPIMRNVEPLETAPRAARAKRTWRRHLPAATLQRLSAWQELLTSAPKGEVYPHPAGVVEAVRHAADAGGGGVHPHPPPAAVQGGADEAKGACITRVAVQCAPDGGVHPHPPGGDIRRVKVMHKGAAHWCTEVLVQGHVLWYTDGASSNNQDSRFRRAGYGAICGAELRAVVAVLERDPRPVLLATDSAYVHDGAKRNLQRWRAQGWRRRAASPRLIANVDLLRRLHELLSAPGRSVQWRKVKGHATSADVAEGRVTQQDADGNACADDNATAGAALHAVPREELEYARLRLRVARAVQQMHIEICQAKDASRKQRAAAARGAEETVPLPAGAAAMGNERYPAYPWGWRPAGSCIQRVPTAGHGELFHSGGSTLARLAGLGNYAHGKRLWDALAEWLSELRWPAASAPQADGGISGAELVIDFEVATGLDIPPALREMQRIGCKHLIKSNMGLLYYAWGTGADADAALLDKIDPGKREKMRRPAPRAPPRIAAPRPEALAALAGRPAAARAP
eukprot:gene19350-biopygen18682